LGSELALELKMQLSKRSESFHTPAEIPKALLVLPKTLVRVGGYQIKGLHLKTQRLIDGLLQTIQQRKIFLLRNRETMMSQDKMLKGTRGLVEYLRMLS